MAINPAVTPIKTARSAATLQAPTTEFGGLCIQCEQTEHNTGCGTTEHNGVCGKSPQTAALQDLLVHQLTGIAQYATAAKKITSDAVDSTINKFLLQKMFSTLTNVNFDQTAFESYLAEGEGVKARAKALYQKTATAAGSKVLAFATEDDFDISKLLGNRDSLKLAGRSVGVLSRKAEIGNDDLWGLGEMCLYGLKGMMAYSEHARQLGANVDEVVAFAAEVMATLATTKDRSLEEMLALNLKVGEMNLKAMAALDAGHTSTFGNPEPTTVSTSAVVGKCMLISGHDIHDLVEVLERTKDKNINVYTHGELLPANSYPALKKYKHLIGNWGGAWQSQRVEFSRFPGAILMTSNCIVEPQKMYRERIFTRNFVGWEGIRNIGEDWAGFDAVIDAALGAPGFTKAEEPTSVPGGFAHHAVLSLAGPIIEAVKSGDIKHFFVIGGCDGAEGDRSYFGDLAKNLPQDAVILTLGCGKYRFIKHNFQPTAGGIPRILDVGQCNDAYSAIKIASALAEAFETDVNSLPLSFAVSWFEQKAVAVLLTLLHLGIKNIRLGPRLPAFATPAMLKILGDTYGLRPIDADNYDKDLEQMLAGN